MIAGSIQFTDISILDKVKDRAADNPSETPEGLN